MQTVTLSPIKTIRLGAFGSAHDGMNECRTELDSHADTCVVGPNTALIVNDFGRPVRVHGYDETVSEVNNCRTVTAVVAYDHPATGETYMLTIHQAIEIPTLKANLLSTVQLRDNDVYVNEEPKHMASNPTDDHHCIKVDMDGGEPLVIPLAMHGVFSYFPTRKPTASEYERSELCMRVELTAELPEWDPTTDRFEKREAAMLDSQGHVTDVSSFKTWSQRHVIAALNTLPQECQPDCDLATALGRTARVRSVSAKEKRSIGMVQSGKRGKAVNARTLAKNWAIGLSVAERTIEATTQNGLRTIIHPHLSRRFRTNDRQLRYRRLAHDMFTDTLVSKIPSWFRRNRYAQVFATKFGWVRVYPMKRKSDAHEGFSLMAQRDGVPPLIVCDGAKEQIMGEFRRKAKEAGCRVKQTEPHSPWQNAAEHNIGELKKGAGRKMARSKCPKNLWDHCLELEAMIRSNTALSHYELEGQVPETIVSGQTSDISPFVEFPWYEWVVWWDTVTGFPTPVLGKWLGQHLILVWL